MTAEEQQKKDEQYMRKALQEAQQAFEEGEIPIGAIVVCQDRVIARAHNLTETLNDVTAHAEMQAVTAAANELGGKYLTDCTLYVTVEPCTMCAAAISFARISNLYFGAIDEKGGAVVSGVKFYESPTCHHRPTVHSGILEQPCSEILKSFFKAKRKSI
jgi:tRNA(adenine34) deaminase